MRELRQSGVERGPLLGFNLVAVDHDVGDSHLTQFRDAGVVREPPHLQVQLVVKRRAEAAVAMHRLLPVRHRVEHGHGLEPLEPARVARVGQRHLGDDEWRRLRCQPAIDGRGGQGVVGPLERVRVESASSSTATIAAAARSVSGVQRTAKRSNPAAANTARHSVVRIMNREGARMKFMPGQE